MKLYRKLDKQQRLIIPKDLLEQIGFTNLRKDDKIEMELDIIELNGQKLITLNKSNRKVLK